MTILMDFENLSKKISILPNEIQYKIMSYSYSPQNPELCMDICNYYSTIQVLYDQYYKTYIEEWIEEEPEHLYWLINDIIGYMNGYYPISHGLQARFYNIVRRSFMYNDNNKVEDIVKKFTQNLNKGNINYKIQIIWGLLLPEERFFFISDFVKDIDLYIEMEEQEEEDWDF